MALKNMFVGFTLSRRMIVISIQLGLKWPRYPVVKYLKLVPDATKPCTNLQIFTFSPITQFQMFCQTVEETCVCGKVLIIFL
jgi:hypothetical protein